MIEFETALSTFKVRMESFVYLPLDDLKHTDYLDFYEEHRLLASTLNYMTLMKYFIQGGNTRQLSSLRTVEILALIVEFFHRKEKLDEEVRKTTVQVLLN